MLCGNPPSVLVTQRKGHQTVANKEVTDKQPYFVSYVLRCYL